VTLESSKRREAPVPGTRHRVDGGIPVAAAVPSPLKERVLTATFWTICFGLLATLLYFYGLHSYWGNADLVRGLLQGQDIAKGNVLLNHWTSSADNFLSIDLIFFTIGILIVGQKVFLLHLISSLIWAALIFAGGYIAALGLTRWTRLWAMLTVLVVLGLPSPLLAQALSQTMVHVGTCLFVLLAFIALQSGRFGRGWTVAVVLLTAATFGDPLALAFGLAPVFVVGVLESVRKRDWRRGLATSSASIVAVIAAGLLRLVADQLGTFALYTGAPLASSSGMVQNLRSLFPDVLSLFGVGSSLRSSSVPWELEIFRSFGLLAAMIGLLVGAWYLLRGVLSGRGRGNVPGLAARGETSFRLSDLLVLGVLGDIALYVKLGLPSSALHYLTPAIIFASILGAMLVGRFIQQRSSRRNLQLLTAAAVLIAGCCASSVAIIMTDPVPALSYDGVGTFLAAHHLYKGVGDYWTSAPITVYSGEKVTVRQGRSLLHGRTPALRHSLEVHVVHGKVSVPDLQPQRVRVRRSVLLRTTNRRELQLSVCPSRAHVQLRLLSHRGLEAASDDGRPLKNPPCNMGPDLRVSMEKLCLVCLGPTGQNLLPSLWPTCHSSRGRARRCIRTVSAVSTT
jgi:hypothetical protein